MADFYVYSRIHHAGRGFYLAAVTAQPVNPGDVGIVEEVKWCSGLIHAERAQKEMSERMSGELYQRGHRPIPVMDDLTARKLMPR